MDLPSTPQTDWPRLFFDAFRGRPRPLGEEILRSEVHPYEGSDLRSLLAARTVVDLAAEEIRTSVESNLWMLTSRAFLYFLPAFLLETSRSYDALSVFASELLGALTQPVRDDVVEAIDRFDGTRSDLGLPVDLTDHLRTQQLEWFDSGAPSTLFRQRFENLTAKEGAAILTFLTEFRRAHGQDFPLGELDNAIDRFWSRFRSS